MDTLKAHWRGLATREQQLLLAAVVAIVLGIFYWGIWSPISSAEINAERTLQAEQNTLNYVKQTANKIMALKSHGGAKTATGSISSIISQTARQYNLVITRMQPQGNKIQLWMDDVPFEALLGYLNELVRGKGLALNSIDLKMSDRPGYVEVRRIQLSL